MARLNNRAIVPTAAIPTMAPVVTPTTTEVAGRSAFFDSLLFSGALVVDAEDLVDFTVVVIVFVEVCPALAVVEDAGAFEGDFDDETGGTVLDKEIVEINVEKLPVSLDDVAADECAFEEDIMDVGDFVDPVEANFPLAVDIGVIEGPFTVDKEFDTLPVELVVGVEDLEDVGVVVLGVVAVVVVVGVVAVEVDVVVVVEVVGVDNVVVVMFLSRTVNRLISNCPCENRPWPR